MRARNTVGYYLCLMYIGLRTSDTLHKNPCCIGPGLRLLLRQEIDDDPGVEAAVASAWQDGELRVRESFAQGEGMLYGDLLVAIADYD